MNVPVVYLPNTAFGSILTVDQLCSLAPWEQRTSARYEAFWSTRNEPYTYGQGRGTRTYYPSPMPDLILELKKHMESQVKPHVGFPLGMDMCLCFVNRYDTQYQHLGWHADDSPEQDDDMPIVVQSYGAERELWIRPNGTMDVSRLKLEHGSTLIMLPGMQQTHQHRIPKHPQPCGMRISLTWRALK